MMKEVIFMHLILAVICLLLGGNLYAGQSRVESVAVKTRAPSNKVVTFWYRVPSSYQEDPRRTYRVDPRRTYRVLVIFGGRNSPGKAEVSGKLGWPKWADEQEVFLIAPGYRDDNYWEPKEWSGNALMKALRQIQKKYNICMEKLLFYGYSAGSQCSNLFPAWKPENARAWVSHACGVFHEPTGRMRNVPGLVTCGDADTTRYIISRNFVDKCREKGINIIWKSFLISFTNGISADLPCGTSTEKSCSSATIRKADSTRLIPRKPGMSFGKTVFSSLHWKLPPPGENRKNERPFAWYAPASPVSSFRGGISDRWNNLSLHPAPAEQWQCPDHGTLRRTQLAGRQNASHISI